MKEKDKVIGVLMPEKRFYSVSRAVMTEAAIDGGFTAIYMLHWVRKSLKIRGLCVCIINHLFVGSGLVAY